MIEGLKIEISSGELKAHLDAKADFHSKKATAYEKQAHEVAKVGGANAAMTNDPVHSLQMSAAQHLRQAKYFDFLAGRIIPDETYRLQENDLQRLEWFERLG